MDSRKIIKLLAPVALVALATPIWGFARWVETLDAPSDPFEHVDAIVTLAGGSGRMQRGLDLLMAESGEILLLSGTYHGVGLAEIFPDRDLSGLPAGGVVVIESLSTSPHENAIEARGVLRAGGLGRPPVTTLALITSNYHMRRAELIFREVFGDEVRIYAVPVSDPDTERDTWWKTRRGRRLVLTEFSKWCWYRIRF